MRKKDYAPVVAGQPLALSKFHILAALADGSEKHGYALMMEICQRLPIGPAVLYSTCAQLYAAGLIRSTHHADPRRTQTYWITDTGTQALRDEIARMKNLIEYAQAQIEVGEENERENKGRYL